MKKLAICAAAFLGLTMMSNKTFAQLQDEKNVVITMDLQPILQLDMTTPDQIDFVFDDISDYYGGITKYGATILKVSSTVDWDLWAVGTSQANMATGANQWDLQLQYGFNNDPNATTLIPLSALELHQHLGNQGQAAVVDYSTPFQTVTTLPAATPGQNSIYYANAAGSIYTVPAATEKFIQGGNANTDFIAGGSYLTPQLQNPAIVSGSNLIGAFYNVIDYRILPSLPVIFPCAGSTAGTEDIDTQNGGAGTGASGFYAAPGVYTMNVKYILSENQ